MKQFFLIILLLGTISCMGTTRSYKDTGKRIIDTSVFGKWSSVGNPVISADGHFVSYSVSNRPVGSSTLVLQSTEDDWKREYLDASGGSFSGDSYWAYYRIRDSLCIVRLGRMEGNCIDHVKSYKVLERKGKSWVAYLWEAGGVRELVLRETGSGREDRYEGVLGYWFSGDARKLVWQSAQDSGHSKIYELHVLDLEGEREKKVYRGTEAVGIVMVNKTGSVTLYSVKDTAGGLDRQQLHWYDLPQGRDRLIGESSAEGGYRFDDSGEQLVYMSAGSIWYYRGGMERSVEKASNQSAGIDSNLELNRGEPPTFSRDGRRILFTLIEKELPKALPEGVKVDVWSYQDKELQSAQQASASQGRKTYRAVCSVEASSVVRIEQAGETYGAQELQDAQRYVLVIRRPGIECWWQPSQRAEVSLVSLEDGSRTLFHKEINYNPYHIVFDLSPGEQYIVYYDPFSRGYYSYEIASGHMHALTKGMGVSWEKEVLNPWPDPNFSTMRWPVGLAGWLDGDRRVLVYDNYDIWSVDPAGTAKAENLTGGYGRKHHTRFKLLSRGNGAMISADYARGLSGKDEVCLDGFDIQTRASGLYRQPLTGKVLPSRIFMGPYASGAIRVYKAAAAVTWIIKRSGPSDAPNLHVTRDFKSLKRLSDEQPQAGYNWYRTELVRWKLPDGDSCHGVLFTPENLDPTKKYPVLFNYYETSSDGLYDYYVPRWTNSTNVNVPYYVSRGYLIFMPDIHIHIGHAGASALASVESAARWLSRRPYVDASKMGLLGHSYGGYETNYIVTHSRLFAAAAEGAGMSDFISGYGTIFLGGSSCQLLYEVAQNRVGATLWQRPELYLENSPIIKAERVETPVLILHNKLDGNVPWEQGVEWFTALRRLGKPSWLLQYDGEDHSLGNANNIKDYTIRQLQFFDHYLKGALPPQWMTKGIEARWKGIDLGYQVNSNRRIP